MKNCKRKQSLYLISTVLLIIAMALTLTACGDTEEVVEGVITVPDDYSTIQEAIDAAEDGDVIVVRPGRYTERIDFKGKNITLRSTDPSDSEVVRETIIDAGGVDSVVTFRSGESENAVLTGFTITGGSGNMEILEFEIEGEMREVPSLYGGGIIILNDSSPTISNNLIKDNVAERGGGILVYGSSPTIESNIIRDNLSTGGGGGLFLANASLQLNNNEIINNSAGRSGGGVAVTGEGEGLFEITGNRVSDNRAENGAAFSIFEASPDITDNQIINNVAAGTGGGFYLINCASLLTGNDISDNRAGPTGGGIAIYFDSAPEITDNLIIGNEADAGGGLSVYINSSPVVKNNTISDNRARLGAGILVNEDSTPEIKENDITENYAERNGAGLFIQASTVIFEGNLVRNNEARRDGGGVYAVIDAILIASDNNFENNRASEGGAIFITDGATIELGAPDSNIYEGNIPNNDIIQR